MINYYKLKDDVNQEILSQFGYTRENTKQNFSKTIRKDDMFIVLSVHRVTKRIEMSGYYYNIDTDEVIKDLIEANLVEAVEKI